MKFYVRTMSAVSATAGGMDAGTRLIRAFSPADAARLFGRRIMTTLKTLTLTSALLLGCPPVTTHLRPAARAAIP